MLALAWKYEELNHICMQGARGCHILRALALSRQEKREKIQATHTKAGEIDCPSASPEGNFHSDRFFKFREDFYHLHVV